MNYLIDALYLIAAGVLVGVYLAVLVRVAMTILKAAAFVAGLLIGFALNPCCAALAWRDLVDCGRDAIRIDRQN